MSKVRRIEKTHFKLGEDDKFASSSLPQNSLETWEKNTKTNVLKSEI